MDLGSLNEGENAGECGGLDAAPPVLGRSRVSLSHLPDRPFDVMTADSDEVPEADADTEDQQSAVMSYVVMEAAPLFPIPGEDPIAGEDLAVISQASAPQLSVYHDSNILIVLDLRAVPTGPADHHGGLFQSHIETAQATLANLLHAYGMIGTVQATVVAFARGATLHFPWGQAPAAIASLNSLRAEHVANGANPIMMAHDAWTAGGHVAENSGNIVYFLSCGEASAEGGVIDHLPVDEKRQWNKFLHGPMHRFDRVFAVGFNHPAIVM